MNNYPSINICLDCQKQLNDIGISKPCALCHINIDKLFIQSSKVCGTEDCHNNREEHSYHCSKCMIKIKEIEDLIESIKLHIKSVVQHLNDKYGIEKVCIFETN